MSEDDKRIDNAPHDEEMVVSDGESIPDQDSEPSQASGSPRVAPTHSAADGESLQFGDEFDSRDDGSPGKGGNAMANQPYDEAVDVSSDGTHGIGMQSKNEEESDASSASEDNEDPGGPVGMAPAQPKSAQSNQSAEDDEESETSSDDDGDDDGSAPADGYDPSEYANLDVSEEVQELFQYIGRYKPQTIELETKLKPFIPDFLPAIGEIDPFLKIPRPDGKKDELGLTVLDEPNPNQTDPTVLDLQLRAISTQTSLEPINVQNIENAAQNPQKISKWIQSIAELHRTNPPPNVIYSKTMPDMEVLMSMWSPEMEEALEGAQLPSAELNVDTKAYARIVCALLDIPVHQLNHQGHEALTESLHHLFTLYSEFKAGQQESAAAADAVWGP